MKRLDNLIQFLRTGDSASTHTKEKNLRMLVDLVITVTPFFSVYNHIFGLFSLPQSFNEILRVFQNICVLLKFLVTFTNEQLCTIFYKNQL